MNIHEYQGKKLLKKYGVAVPRGEVASTPEEAETYMERNRQIAREMFYLVSSISQAIR